MNTGFVTVTYVIACCHGCGEALTRDGETPILFGSVLEADDFFTCEFPEPVGWEFDGEILTCDCCLAMAHCEEHGHIWSGSRWAAWNGLPGIFARQDRACVTCGIYESEARS